jgi:hypothetical protein
MHHDRADADGLEAFQAQDIQDLLVERGLASLSSQPAPRGTSRRGRDRDIGSRAHAGHPWS